MVHKTIYCALALSFMIVLTPRVVSPGADELQRTREAPAGRGIGGLHQVIVPTVESGRRILRETTPSGGLQAPWEKLGDLEAAEHFMQLKAAVYADLDRLDRPRHATPKAFVVRGLESESNR